MFVHGLNLCVSMWFFATLIYIVSPFLSSSIPLHTGVLDFVLSGNIYKVSPGMRMHVARVYQIKLMVVFILTFLC